MVDIDDTSPASDLANGQECPVARRRLMERVGRRSNYRARDDRERKARRKAALKRYDSSPRGRYHQQRQNARRRDIPWEITFSEWCEVWEQSGHWDERGLTATSYVMSRLGDKGPYRAGNVTISQHRLNVADGNRNRIAFESDPDWRHVHNAEGIE